MVVEYAAVALLDFAILTKKVMLKIIRDVIEKRNSMNYGCTGLAF